MQATIYVTAEAFDTAQSMKDLDHYDRATLCDEVPDFAVQSGYHFKNANKLELAVLPGDATVECVELIVTFPAELRGCIFEAAPNLPLNYAEIVTYWSGETVNASSSGAAYYQCALNEYMVNLGPDPVYSPVVTDRLLSEGIVVAVTGLAVLLAEMSPDAFIEIKVPIDPEMLGIEPDAFRSTSKYAPSLERFDQVFLKVADILVSPDSDRVYIDLLCNELIDYGYWY